jgi:hypothetical protein
LAQLSASRGATLFLFGSLHFNPQAGGISLGAADKGLLYGLKDPTLSWAEGATQALTSASNDGLVNLDGAKFDVPPALAATVAACCATTGGTVNVRNTDWTRAVRGPVCCANFGGRIYGKPSGTEAAMIDKATGGAWWK